MARDPLVLNYFMWGYQPHFRSSLQSNAKAVFGGLSPLVIPTVSLVGKLAPGCAEGHPICPDPEEAYDISVFASINDAIEKIGKADPDRKMFHSLPQAAENHRRRLEKRWLRDGILGVIRASDSAGIFFASSPQRIGNYNVLVILRFEKDQYERFYSLHRQEVGHRLHVQRSLIEATVYEFLTSAEQALRSGREKAQVGIGTPTDEIIRRAAKHLMYTPAYYGGSIDGLHGLYEACENLSLCMYEGGEASGRLIIARQDHPNVETIVRFAQPSQVRNVRSIRKILETSSQDIALLSDSHLLYGLGRTRGVYDGSTEDLYEVLFTKRHHWSLIHARNILMQVVDGMPSLPKKRLSKEKILSDLVRIFPKNKPKTNAKIYKLIERAAKQRHGTMIVISPEAKNEARRLAGQSTPIEVISMTEELVASLSSIDGAILLSPGSQCHAIGVVLDGVATKNGDPARGARYNSAIRYIEQHPGSLAVVVSEDGSINLVPDLRPQFPRALIDEKIIEAKNLLAQSSLDERDLTVLANWFTGISFYLTPEDCSVANQVIKRLDARPLEVGELRIKYAALEPHEEMNESYYA